MSLSTVRTGSKDPPKLPWRERVRKAWERMPAHRRCDIKAFTLLIAFAVLSLPFIQAASAATQDLRDQGERVVRVLDRAADSIERAKQASGDDARVDALVDRARDVVVLTADSGDGGNRVDRLLDRAETLLDQTERDPAHAARSLDAAPQPSDR